MAVVVGVVVVAVAMMECLGRRVRDEGWSGEGQRIRGCMVIISRRVSDVDDSA
jgi:hypothetical protein